MYFSTNFRLLILTKRRYIFEVLRFYEDCGSEKIPEWASVTSKRLREAKIVQIFQLIYFKLQKI